ncbi:TetR/AcrR family transcriptional regulator [Brevibacterium casei]|uniref:TetR/AcrR family transcriptional regulator n=1 Tax=Brevibacterium TaxID=1696 RepID=UPI0014322340|nr:TetR/AcrR family transcriptional regulator [Brevibacterium casei]NJE68217.1 TetR/AcrR family transcriptional regulator [Brevibacterium sp. LS14]
MTDHESLRTKKARATRTALHEAAITRVLDEGLDSVTVAMIAADAGVSPRTFFNYFQTKEDAIVGLDVSTIDTQLVRDYVESDTGIESLAEDTANFVREALLVGTDPRLSVRRRQLFAAYPELVTKRFEQVEALEELVSEHVLARLKHLGQEFSSEDSAWRSARMLTQLCMVPLQHAARVVKRTPDLAAAPDGTKNVYDDSLGLFLKVLERLR